MRRIILLLVVSLSLAYAGFRFGSNSRALAQATMQPVPFTAEVLERRLDATGTEKYRETSLSAMRGDGTTIRIIHRTFPDGKTYEFKTIIDVVHSTRIVLDQATESRTTYPLSNRSVQLLVNSTAYCGLNLDTERMTTAGYEALRQDNSTKKLTAVRWLAPALNCFPLKETTQSATSTNSREVTSVRLGEPDATLFVIPDNYTERTPSQVFNEFVRRFPGRQLPPVETTTALDDAYANHQKFR